MVVASCEIPNEFSELSAIGSYLNQQCHKFLLRAKTAEGADKSQLSAKYFQDYNQLKALSQAIHWQG